MKLSLVSALFCLVLHSNAKASLAYGTKISLTQGQQKIETIKSNDEVMTSRGVKKVIYSSGAAESLTRMVMIVQERGEALLVSPEQPIYLANNSFVRAKDLTTTDQLVSSKGSPVKIFLISEGIFQGGLHQLGVAGSVENHDEHTLIANGVVIGDYLIQLNCPRICEQR